MKKFLMALGVGLSLLLAMGCIATKESEAIGDRRMTIVESFPMERGDNGILLKDKDTGREFLVLKNNHHVEVIEITNGVEENGGSQNERRVQ